MRISKVSLAFQALILPFAMAQRGLRGSRGARGSTVVHSIHKTLRYTLWLCQNSY